CSGAAAGLVTVGGIEGVGWSPHADRGIREIERLRPDFVLLDMHLAERTGFDVMRALRNKNGRTWVRVYAITSDWSRGLRNACLDAGAEDCFDKAEPAGLIERVKRLAPPSRSPAARRGLQQTF